VETPLGTRYTRAGSFQIDQDGNLVNTDGYAVLNPSGQRIVFPENVKNIEIGSIGNIKVDGDDFGALGVVQFENEHLLERMGTIFIKRMCRLFLLPK
jgi:flagellar basal body rod protein FlgG